ncbi:M20/M25/M40 family metallo-hydrolase [Sphingomonas montana]|uniref:M20/M25/M40 family metallo-hydrolase n=1 Tax=Sphingomonas montana TaxID=1843236 RepID=UPI001F0AD741|nr:M20/M25/M40 family metallo-hydrolase [Sphingomonas montana]
MAAGVGGLLAPIAPAVAQGYDMQARTLLGSAKFKQAKARLDADYDRIIADIVTLTEVEAPPFKEATRGALFGRMLAAEGLADITTDAEGNVYGTLKGSGTGSGATRPVFVVTAHLDTVFPAGTNVKVKRAGNKLMAPGIGDDTSSLPVLLAFIRAIKAAGFTPATDIVFMGNVGEEGPGDLRGVRYLFGKGPLKDRIKYFISFEPGRGDRITNAGAGSKRYKVTFTGPGGHSMGNFGIVNPSYALADAMVRFGRMTVPATPKTVYNVGIVEGGTSVNSIPFAMSMMVDMRSGGKAELDAVEKQFLAILPAAVDAENAARSTASGKIGYTVTPIGDRPVGAVAMDADIMRMAVALRKAAGVTPTFGTGSSDSNIPWSMGREAITLGSGFETQGAHSLDEYLVSDRPRDVENMVLGLATVLLIAGAK